MPRTTHTEQTTVVVTINETGGLDLVKLFQAGLDKLARQVFFGDITRITPEYSKDETVLTLRVQYNVSD